MFCSNPFNNLPLSMGWKWLWINSFYSTAWIHVHIIFRFLTGFKSKPLWSLFLKHGLRRSASKMCERLSLVFIFSTHPWKSQLPLFCELLSQLTCEGYSILIICMDITYIHCVSHTTVYTPEHVVGKHKMWKDHWIFCYI